MEVKRPDRNVPEIQHCIHTKQNTMSMALYFSLFSSDSSGFIKSFLSLGFWLPLSNISFASYLSHPVLILLYMGLQETPTHYTALNFVSALNSPFHSISSSSNAELFQILPWVGCHSVLFYKVYFMSPLFIRCTCSLVTWC